MSPRSPARARELRTSCARRNKAGITPELRSSPPPSELGVHVTVRVAASVLDRLFSWEIRMTEYTFVFKVVAIAARSPEPLPVSTTRKLAPLSCVQCVHENASPSHGSFVWRTTGKG
jgi:hypothetical protein